MVGVLEHQKHICVERAHLKIYLPPLVKKPALKKQTLETSVTLGNIYTLLLLAERQKARRALLRLSPLLFSI
jgi:hypothetical protein